MSAMLELTPTNLQTTHATMTDLHLVGQEERDTLNNRVHRPFIEESAIGSRLRCECTETGEWTAEDEAGFDLRLHVLDTGGTTSESRKGQVGKPVHTESKIRRENYLFMRDNNECFENICARLNVDPVKFAMVVDTWEVRGLI